MEIERYDYPILELNLNGKYVTKIYNDVELVRVQSEIAKHKLGGYSIGFEDKIIPIESKDGEIKDWPNGMYDEWMISMSKLFQIRKDNYEKKDRK